MMKRISVSALLALAACDEAGPSDLEVAVLDSVSECQLGLERVAEDCVGPNGYAIGCETLYISQSYGSLYSALVYCVDEECWETEGSQECYMATLVDHSLGGSCAGILSLCLEGDDPQSWE
jgi:hypothetical protein